MSLVDRTVDWDAVASVRSAESRREVLEVVAAKPRCASEIAEDVERSRASVSQNLRALRQREPALVECLTPDRPHHRLYTVTQEGEAVVENL